MMLLVLSIFGFLIGSSFSASSPPASLGITRLYRDTTCASPLPYQIEVVYAGVCIYNRANPSATSVNPAIYYNAFTNGTVIIHAYQSGPTQSATCTGAFNTLVQNVQLTCQIKKDSVSNVTYSEQVQFVAYSPTLLTDLIGNRPYAQVNSYSGSSCNSLYKQTIFFMDSCSGPIVYQGNNIYLSQTCNSTGIIQSSFDSSTCLASKSLGAPSYSYLGPAPGNGNVPTCVNNQPPTNGYDVDPDTYSYSYYYKCDPVNSARPTTAPVGPTKAPGSVASSAPNSQAPASSSPPSSSSSSSCFAGSETVAMASGESRAISAIQVGDEIAVAAMDGAFAGYSPVIAVPHTKNSLKATFTQISTVSGRDIKMTPDHLVLGGACGSPSLVQAGSLKVDECVQTVSGIEAVASVTTVAAEGIYTVITKYDGLLIVNGVVASPFALNHLVTNSFYNIVRFVYGVVPSVAKTSVTGQIINAFGELVTRVFA